MIYIASMNLRGARAVRPEGTIAINVTSAQGKEHPNRRDFSPMTPIKGGYHGYYNFEAAWQSGKRFQDNQDHIVKSFWKNVKEPKRRYPGSKGKKVLSASFDWCFPNEEMDYVTSRKRVYVPFYHDLMKNTEMARYWKEQAKNTDIVIYDFDGPRMEDGSVTCLEVTAELLREKINDTRFPFGHGYVVAAHLAGIDVNEFV